MRRRDIILTPAVSLALSLVAMQLVTLEWTPDCGGVSYGLPLPWVSTSMASSMAFSFFILRFAVDWICYAAMFALPTWFLVGRRSMWAAALSVVAMILGLGNMTLWFATGLSVTRESQRSLYVYEWRSTKLFAGFPAWRGHLEDHCN